MLIKKLGTYLFNNTSTKQTLFKNTFRLLVAEAVNKWSVLLVSLMVAKSLWPEQFWVMNFVISFIGMFIVLTDFWLTTLMVREVSKEKTQIGEFFIHWNLLKLILWCLTMGIVILASLLMWNNETYTYLIFVYCAYAVLTNISDFIKAFCRPSEHMQHEAILKVSNGIALFAFISYALYAQWDIYSIMYAFLAAWILNFVLSLVYIWIYKQERIHIGKIRLQTLYTYIKKWRMIGAGILFVNIYISIDQVILWYYWLTYDLGLYALAYKLSFVYTIIFAMAFQTLLPRLSQAPSQETYYSWIKRISKANILLFLAYQAIAIFLYTQTIRDLWVYRASIPIFMWLLFYCIFESYAHRWFITLMAMWKEKSTIYIFIICAACNALLNIIFVPHFSYMASVGANVITYMIYFFLTKYYIHRYFFSERVA